MSGLLPLYSNGERVPPGHFLCAKCRLIIDGREASTRCYGPVGTVFSERFEVHKKPQGTP